MIPAREALHEVMARVPPMGDERVSLALARGRVCATDVHARSDSPAFDNSAMDGYAVRAREVTAAGARLGVVGESRAGGPAPGPLAPRSAMRIFTGAPMPEGADSVVIQEDTRREGTEVTCCEAPREGQHVRARGSDLLAGAVAVSAGTPLGAGELALLASQDMASVAVTCRPRVAILSTGDELRDIGEPAAAGSIVNSNAYMLAAQVEAAGAEARAFAPVPDRLEEAAARLAEALACDVVLCTGGVSVGDYDVMGEAMQRAGVQVAFEKVRMKPGKPLRFGRHETTPVVGLPGNPVSAFVGFELFVWPLLRAMQGDARPYRMRVPVRLAAAHARRPGRLEFARARLTPTSRGLCATLLGRQGSGALPYLTGVDALVMLPSAEADFAAGAPLHALLLGGPGSDLPPLDGID